MNQSFQERTGRMLLIFIGLFRIGETEFVQNVQGKKVSSLGLILGLTPGSFCGTDDGWQPDRGRREGAHLSPLTHLHSRMHTHHITAQRLKRSQHTLAASRQAGAIGPATYKYSRSAVNTSCSSIYSNSNQYNIPKASYNLWWDKIRSQIRNWRVVKRERDRQTEIGLVVDVVPLPDSTHS